MLPDGLLPSPPQGIMTPEQVTTVITSILQGGGMSYFVWYLVKGLRERLKALNDLVETQKKTLVAMEQRVSETEKMGAAYRKFLREMPKDMNSYKAFMRSTKDEIIAELRRDNECKAKLLREAHDQIGKTLPAPADAISRMRSQTGAATLHNRRRNKKAASTATSSI